MIKLSTATAAVALLVASPAAYAGYGYTHTETTHQQQTESPEHSATRYRTEHERVNVPDVTHLKEITRVHPRIHEQVIERYLHHVVPRDENTYETHRHYAPERVEKSYRQEQVGHAAPAREHTEVRYHDVYRDENRQVVHEHHVEEIGLTIHRHVTDVTISPLLHETIVTRLVPETVYQHSTEVEHSEVVGAAQVIRTYKREDVDP